MNAGPMDAGNFDWVAEKSVVAYGVRIGLRANKPEYLDRLLALLPSVWKPSSSSAVERSYSLKVGAAGSRKNGRSYHQLFEDGLIAAYSRDMDEVLEIFERLLKMYLAEMARRRVFVHAGAVGWRGKAIIIPGRSMSGKTSLVAELVRAGATYYSDEYAVLDNRGRVHPYATPLAVREPGSHKQKSYSVEQFGGAKGVKPLPVGLVVVTKYKSDGDWQPSLISTGQAILELLAHTVPARRKPEAVVGTLQQAAAKAVTLKGARGEAGETAKFIVNYLLKSQQNSNGA